MISLFVCCLFVWLMIYRLHMVIFRHDQLAEASWNSPKLGDCQLLTMYRPCLCTSDGCIRTCIHYIHCMALQCIALHYIRKYIHTNTHIGIQTYIKIYTIDILWYFAMLHAQSMNPKFRPEMCWELITILEQNASGLWNCWSTCGKGCPKEVGALIQVHPHADYVCI